jgi:hypothetical protein
MLHYMLYETVFQLKHVIGSHTIGVPLISEHIFAN